MSILQLIKARGILTEHFGLPVLVELGRKVPRSAHRLGNNQPASRQTGQSLPNIMRSHPKLSTTCST